MKISTGIRSRSLAAVFATGMLLAPARISAETHYKPHISIGAHGGMSMSRMSFSPSVPQSWNDGVMFGVHARYAEEKLVGIVAELNFEQRGWKESFEDNPALDYSRTLNYIELPVMTHIYFGSNRFKFFVNLGPEFGYMISNSISSNFDYTHPAGAGIASTRRVNQMSMEVKHKFDYGICAGLGCEWWARPRHSVYIEARFYYGLGNIYDSSKADEFSASRGMNLAFTAGYNFRLK